MSHLNAERLDEYAFVKNYKLDIIFDETGRKVGQKWIDELQLQLDEKHMSSEVHMIFKVN